MVLPGTGQVKETSGNFGCPILDFPFPKRPGIPWQQHRDPPRASPPAAVIRVLLEKHMAIGDVP
jgi:hypothetical protein